MLNPGALVNVRAVRRYTGDAELSEARAHEFINMYSAAIQAWLERQFLPVEGTFADPAAVPPVAELFVTKTFVCYGAGRQRVDFSRPGEDTEAQHVESIRINADRVYAAEVGAVDYRLLPRGRTAHGTHWGVQLDLYPTDRWGVEVEVTGIWGAGVVPPELRGATLIAIQDGLSNPEGGASRSVGEMGVVEGSEPAGAGSTSGVFLPPDARQMIQGLRRHTGAP